MNGRYSDDDLLSLSGVQHYAFCPRQWALIHVEQQWSENWRTIDGENMHTRCHDEEIRERHGDLLIVRGLRVVSYSLGLSGVCDVVEFRKAQRGVRLSGEEGNWELLPVEYKRGSEKVGEEDRIQLCAQAMALEETFCCELTRGYLYYGATRSRESVSLDKSLRSTTEEIAQRMHDDFRRAVTPSARRRKSCQACSLKNQCLPSLPKKQPVAAYMDSILGGLDDKAS